MENIEFLFLATSIGPLCYYEDDEQMEGNWILFESMDQVEDFMHDAVESGTVPGDFFMTAEVGVFTSDMLERYEGTVLARNIYFENGEIRRDCV